MTSVLQLRRGTAAEHSTFTGAAGEITYDTTDKRAVMHDGSTAGGIPLAKESELPSNPYTVGGTDVALADGGTGASLTDPNDDRIMFWDDSAGAVTWLDNGNGLTITTTTIAVDSASDTVDGIVELATAAETTTGTDATRAITPDGLAGSDYGKAVISILVFDDSQDVTTGDGAGDVFWRVPAVLNGYNLVAVAAAVQTAGTTGTTDIQINNVTQAADMLTTKITIDSTETDSSTAATSAVIDTGNDDVATGDRIRIDVDATSTTAAKGLLVELTFQLP